MKTFRGNPNNVRVKGRCRGGTVRVAIAAVIVCVTFGSQTALGKNNKTQKVYISADKLIADNNAQTAEFIGNVSLKRGNGVITAGRLIIYYERKTENKKVEADRKEMIKKFIARDNVRIKSDQIVARAETAVYSREDRTIILSGPNARVTKGNNSLAGTKITLYIDTEDVQVAGGKKQRVEAVFGPPSESKP